MSFPEPLPLPNMNPDPNATGTPLRDEPAPACATPDAAQSADESADEPVARVAAARARIHDLPLPVTWDLLGAMRRTVPPPLAGTLLAIHEEAIFRTMLHESLPRDGRPQRGVETWIRRFAPLRREWLEVAHEAVGDAGITPLRVEAIAITRAALRRLRSDSAARADLEAALCQAGPILAAYGAARRDGRDLDSAQLRRLSTRFDYCVTSALLAEAQVLCADLHLATPLLCSEARIAAARLRCLLDAPDAPRFGAARRVGAAPRRRSAGPDRR